MKESVLFLNLTIFLRQFCIDDRTMCGRERLIIGTLRSNDADGEENVKKTIDFISKTTALHVHHAFFVHFFPVFARLRREHA